MVEIVPFSPVHAHGVLSLILPIQQAEFAIPVTLETQPDLQDIAGFYQRGIGNFWVALDEQTVVGTIGMLDIGNGQAALRKMFVSSSYRGQEHGVAKALLHTLLGWSWKLRVREVFLGTTSKFLAAHRFYEKNGFRELAKEELPAKFPIMAVDSKFYKIQVQPLPRKA